MRIGCCIPAIMMALAGAAVAQPINKVDDSSCNAETAIVERDMDLARSRGQMLLRRQLADRLAALQASCQPLGPAERRAADIERLERQVLELRAELDAAEAQLRKLRSTVR